MLSIRHIRFLPLITFLLACCFLANLFFAVKPDVFFSGDAGLKFLVVKQLISTGEYKNLALQQPEWVKKIWQQGFYPFGPPFIYDTPTGKLVAFPPAFQWLNVFFYKVFGYRGMYILPMASVILLWLWFLLLFRERRASVMIVSGGLFILACCSPLTIYAAIYWEHTLAVLLLFGGVVFLVRQPGSSFHSQVLGIITGLSVWFRPEAIVLSGLITGIVLYNFFKTKRAACLNFALGSTMILIAFFLFNTVVYRSLLGAHAYQVMGDNGASGSLQQALTILTHINARLFIFFPASVLFYILVLYFLIRKTILPALIWQLAIIIIMYSIITPFILPNAGGKQWGPRYFLPLVPLMVTTLCLMFSHIKINRQWIIPVLAIVAYSSYLNVYVGIKTLRNDYTNRVAPGFKFLRSQTCDVVVVQNQYIAQEYAAAFSSKKFFRAENDINFDTLVNKLKQAGVTRIIYMDVKDNGKSLPNQWNRGSTGLIQFGDYFFAAYDL